jgi:hypothetical protein
MRLHVTGASGSGTSTLADALAREIGGTHVEADDFYWLPSTPPFQHKRPVAERLPLLLDRLQGCAHPVLAGSVVGWGAALEDSFDLVVFLYLDAGLRVERLRAREQRLLGRADPAFLDWAAQYDAGPSQGRSLARHRAWLAARRCPVIELSGDFSVSERVERLRPHLTRALAAPPRGETA